MSLKFSNEPIAWLTFAAAVIQLAIGAVSGNLDITTASALVTAFAGVVARSQVTPTAKINTVPSIPITPDDLQEGP